jgi:antitoxin component of MazEF toxin-antitoxin module
MPNTDYPKFVTTCEETEDGDLAILFPEELLEALGWSEGTTLDFDLVGDRLVIREVERSDLDEV